MTYYVHLFPQNEDVPDRWQADVGFAYWKSEIENLEGKLAGLQVYDVSCRLPITLRDVTQRAHRQAA